MGRNNLVLRAKTSMAQKLPSDLEEKIVSFHSFIRKHREIDGFDDVYMINMDEMRDKFCDVSTVKELSLINMKTLWRNKSLIVFMNVLTISFKCCNYVKIVCCNTL